ncbi:DUF748 domain-containing protein [Polaribacter septentrionalilitoris]|uniref:DUF748 domain-containing protein n=1 Tax=Polaribacter septentrionalilitoris TaxID=2494657 RepID=UPI0013580248|nr:DUF748 domain-containing protein [Polaribacter septentrionalilitoris]
MLSNYLIERKIDKILVENSLKNGISIKATSSVNLLFGDVSLSDIEIEKDSFYIKSKSIQLAGLSYYDAFVNNTFNVSGLKLVAPQFSGKMNDTLFANMFKKDTATPKKMYLKVKNLEIIKGNLNITDAKQNDLKIEEVHLEINDFVFDNQTNTIPFSYQKIFFEVRNLERKVSEVQQLEIENITLKDSLISLHKLMLKPLKSRKNYIFNVTEEKELMDINIDSLQIVNFHIEKTDSLFFNAKTINISNANFGLYQDKTRFSESKKIKKLYSKSLRELPFLLNIDQINIKDSKLTYEELLKRENKPGVLVFDDLNVTIKNINNRKNNKTNVTTTIHSKFMGDSPLHVVYSFKIQDVKDKFRIRGFLKNVTSKNMSSYISPAMNVTMDGFINRMDFDFEGNNWSSNGKFDVMFKDFKIEFLKKKKKKNRLLSWFANLLIKDTSKNGLIAVEVSDVKRNQTKSFWNFFWKNMEKGLMKSLL